MNGAWYQKTIKKVFEELNTSSDGLETSDAKSRLEKFGPNQLPEKNEESLRKIIDQIIDSKIQNKELDDAPITFYDIKLIKSIFLEKLKNIYHVRIQYPKESGT